MTKKRAYLPYLLISPVIFFILVLYAFPIAMIFFQSFTQTSIITGGHKFVGLGNFITLFQNDGFIHSIGVTLKYTVLAVFLKIFIGLAMALFLSSEMYFSRTLKFLSLLPWAIPQVAVAIVWKWILDGNYGYLNYYLMKFGIISHNITWLSDPRLAFLCTAFVDAWLGVSLVSMIFLSGINAISPSLYEAATVDGANSIQKFRMITIPSMKKLLLITTTLVTIWTFNSFNVIFILTGGGPMNATETMILKIYEEAFSKFNIGTSSTISLIVFLILTVLSLLYYRQMIDEEV